MPALRIHKGSAEDMDAIDRELEALGIADVILGAVAGNEDALRLYRRRGFRPTWLYLSRFAGRE